MREARRVFKYFDRINRIDGIYFSQIYSFLTLGIHNKLLAVPFRARLEISLNHSTKSAS